MRVRCMALVPASTQVYKGLRVALHKYADHTKCVTERMWLPCSLQELLRFAEDDGIDVFPDDVLASLDGMPGVMVVLDYEVHMLCGAQILLGTKR